MPVAVQVLSPYLKATACLPIASGGGSSSSPASKSFSHGSFLNRPWLYFATPPPSPPNSYSSLTELLPILLGLLVLGCFFFFFQILILFMEGGVGKPSSICLSVYLAGLGNGTQGLCILSALPRLPSTAQ